MTVSKGNWMVFCKTHVTFIREYLSLSLPMHFELESGKGV